MKLTIELTGIRPILLHNGRLANPIDPWTVQLKSLTSKKKKTDEDLIAIMQTEARGACYETGDGLLGIPNANVWRCIYDAATAFRRGADVKRALMFDDETVPLRPKGREIAIEEFLADPANIDYRPVVVQRNRTMRARPIVREWSSVHEFELLTDVMNGEDLNVVLDRAGRLVGLGEWRPTYGTFEYLMEQQ